MCFGFQGTTGRLLTPCFCQTLAISQALDEARIRERRALEARLREADDAHATKDEKLRALEGAVAVARLKAEEIERAAAEERASFLE